MGSNRYELPLWRLSPSLANMNGIIDAGAPTQPARIFSGSASDVDAVASVNTVSKAPIRKASVAISVSPPQNRDAARLFCFPPPQEPSRLVGIANRDHPANQATRVFSRRKA